MDAIADFYHQKAPRWMKVIKWREIGENFYAKQKLACKVVYVPFAIVYMCVTPDRFATMLFFKRPQTQEEFDGIKRYARFQAQGGVPLNAVRNYELGQYAPTNMPPYFDLSVRRKAYPEYYAGRYDK